MSGGATRSAGGDTAPFSLIGAPAVEAGQGGAAVASMGEAAARGGFDGASA